MTGSEIQMAQHSKPAVVTVLGHATKRRLILVLVGVFVLKAALLFLAVPALSSLLGPRYGIGFGAQGDLYDVIARNLVQGAGYRIYDGLGETMSREPGYVLYLAALFRVAGYGITPVRVGNFVLTAGMTIMVMLLATRVTRNPAHSVLAAVVLALHPAIVVAEMRGGVDLAFTFTVLVFMVVLYNALEHGSSLRYAVAGLVLGGVVMVRSTPVLFPVALGLYLWIASARERLRHVKHVALLTLGMAAIMVPWIVRNYRLIHEFVPTATIVGAAAQEGLYTCRCLTLSKDFRDVVADSGNERNAVASRTGLALKDGFYHQAFYSPRDELAFSRTLLRAAVLDYWSNPALVPLCAIKRLFYIWFLGRTWTVTWLNVFVEVPLLMAALYGGWVLKRRGELHKMGIMLLFVLYMVAVHAVLNAHARYSVPLLPFLTILASVGLEGRGGVMRREPPGV